MSTTLPAPKASSGLRPINLALTPQQVLAGWPRKASLTALWSGGGTAARWTVLAAPKELVRPQGGAILPEGQLRAPPQNADAPPFQGGWVGCLEYELGAHLEPVAATHGPQTGRRTLIHWLRCDHARIYDHPLGRWWAVGKPP